MVIRGHGGEYRVISRPLLGQAGYVAPVDASAFFDSGISTTASYAKVDFGAGMRNITIENTGITNSLEYSFNGIDKHGSIANSASKVFEHVYYGAIWVKNGTGATTVTVSATSEG